MDTYTLLARTSLFSALEAKAPQHLADCCSRQTCPAGATLFVAGDSGDEMFVVVTGSVKVSVASEDGDITLATFGPGDIFGELALLTTGGLRTATAASAGSSELLVIHRQDFESILRASPDFVYRLLCEVAARLKQRMGSSPRQPMEPAISVPPPAGTWRSGMGSLWWAMGATGTCTSDRNMPSVTNSGICRPSWT